MFDFLSLSILDTKGPISQMIVFMFCSTYMMTPTNQGATVYVSGIIIITDGVTSVPDVAVCETLLNQLRSGTIACSFVQVQGMLCQ